MINPISFGNRLKGAIKKAKTTQKDLANTIGVSKTAINNYVKGRIPDAEILYNIAKTLNVSIEWLLDGEYTESHKDLPNVSDNIETYNAYKLSDDEKTIIDLYRQLKQKDKDKFEGMMELTVKNQSEVGKSSTYQGGGTTGVNVKKHA